jgi:transcriptional regulator with XRE-family HTH domain
MAKRHRTVGMRIQEAREDIGMSRFELSRKSGVSYDVLTGYEIGRSEPGFRKMAQIANVLEISLDWFAMGYENDKK